MSIGILILNFIRNNWFSITICVTLFSVYVYIQSLRSTIDDLEASILIEQVKVTECHNTIKSRNKVIEDWSLKTNEQNKRMIEMTSEISKINQSTNQKIQFILKQTRPKTCDEAMEYFVNIGAKYE